MLAEQIVQCVYKPQANDWLKALNLLALILLIVRMKGEEKKDKVSEIQKVQPIFQFLNEDRVEEATKLMTDSFVTLNTLWIQLGAKYHEVYPIVRSKMIYASKSNWSYMYLHPENKEILAIAPALDLVDYLDSLTLPNSSSLGSTLGKYGVELENEYFLSLKPKRGEYIYGYAGAINPKYAKLGISMQFWAIGASYYKAGGWKAYFTRASSRATTKMLGKCGGYVVKTLQVTEPGIKNQKFELVRLDMGNLSMASLSQYFKDKNSEEDL